MLRDLKAADHEIDNFISVYFLMCVDLVDT